MKVALLMSGLSRGLQFGALPALVARDKLFAIQVNGEESYPVELLQLAPEDSVALCNALASESEPAAEFSARGEFTALWLGELQ